MEKCECSQCGSTDFNKEEEGFLRCAYCHSLFRMLPPQNYSSGSGVIIKKGANVTFGKNSKVIIEGGLLVEEGAHVAFLGKLDIVEKATAAEIEKAKSILQLKKEV